MKRELKENVGEAAGAALLPVTEIFPMKRELKGGGGGEEISGGGP